MNGKGIDYYHNGDRYYISSVDLYSNGTVVVNRRLKFDERERLKLGSSVFPSEQEGDNTGRGKIEYMSYRSRSRLAFVATETEAQFSTFLTLTYGKEYPKSGKIVKADLNKMLTKLRSQFSCKNYLWFLEFQTRGAPHFHLALDVEATPYNRTMVARAWSMIAAAHSKDPSDLGRIHKQHKRPGVFEPIKKQDGIARYAVKYALKTRQKEVPRDYQDCGRFWGASRSVKDQVPEPERVSITEGNLRVALQELDHQCTLWDRLPKYLMGVR